MVLSLRKLEVAPPERKISYQRSALWAIKGYPLMLASLGSDGWVFMLRADCTLSSDLDQERARWEQLCSQRFHTRRQALEAAEMAIMIAEDS